MTLFERYTRFQRRVAERSSRGVPDSADSGAPSPPDGMAPAGSGFAVTIVSVSSADLPGANDEPDDPTNCLIEVCFAISDSSADGGADNFGIRFVTPRWLAEHPSDKGWRAMEYTIVVDSFSFELATQAVEALIAEISAPTWDDFVAVFSRFAHWEFSWEPSPKPY